jgi:DtxR family transcriptional regulator, manganese transport regulator
VDNKYISQYRTVRGYQLDNQQENELTPAMEDYLEMVCRQCRENGYTRVNRISELLNVRPSSASKMIARLVKLGYLKYDLYDSILLEEKGEQEGAYLLYRHNTVEQFLRLIGNDDPLKEVELIEHALNVSTVEQVSNLLDFFTENILVKEQYIEFSIKKSVIID